MDIAGIIRLLWAKKHMKVFDFGLIAIRPEYQGQGLTAMIFTQMFVQTQKYNLEYCETNHSLEDNYKILLSWKNFENEQHKRRRCYWKKLNEQKEPTTKKVKKSKTVEGNKIVDKDKTKAIKKVAGNAPEKTTKNRVEQNKEGKIKVVKKETTPVKKISKPAVKKSTTPTTKKVATVKPVVKSTKKKVVAKKTVKK